MKWEKAEPVKSDIRRVGELSEPGLDVTRDFSKCNNAPAGSADELFVRPVMMCNRAWVPVRSLSHIEEL